MSLKHLFLKIKSKYYNNIIKTAIFWLIFGKTFKLLKESESEAELL